MVRGWIPLHLDKVSAQMDHSGSSWGPFLICNFLGTHTGSRGTECQWQRRLCVVLISRPCHRAALVPCAANRHHPPFLLSIPCGWIVGAGS